MILLYEGWQVHIYTVIVGCVAGNANRREIGVICTDRVARILCCGAYLEYDLMSCQAFIASAIRVK